MISTSPAVRCTMALLIVVCLVLMIVPSQLVGEEPGEGNVEIMGLQVRTDIVHSYAVTQIIETLYNPSDEAVNETFLFEVPDSAFLSNLSIQQDGKIHYATIMPKEEADAKFEEAKRTGTTAVKTVSRGKTTFAYSVNIAAGKAVTINLTYEDFLVRRPGGFGYSLSLVHDPLDRPIHHLDIAISIKTADELLWVDTYNYPEAQVEFLSMTEASVTYHNIDVVPEKNFVILYDIGPPPVNGRMLCHTTKDEGFFFHIFSPGEEEAISYIPKDIIFIIDVSGSMGREKISQVKDAFSSIMDKLHPEDRFGIIAFSSSVNLIYSEFIAVSDEGREEAKARIGALDPGGSTNINQALLDGLDMSNSQGAQLPLIVFLTDGLPSQGVVDPSEIRYNVKTANTKGAGIYSLGFGDDVDFSFLDALSKENNGKATKIYTGKDAIEQIQDFYSIISTPLLQDIHFSYQPIAKDVVPTHTPYLFSGSEIVVTGKVPKQLSTLVSNVTAVKNDEKVAYIETFRLDCTKDKEFIPRFWAYATIKALLDQIHIEGENEQLKQEVVDLSLEHGFMTSYTSFYVEIGKQHQAQPEPLPPPTGGPGMSLCSGFRGPPSSSPTENTQANIMENGTHFINPIEEGPIEPVEDIKVSKRPIGMILWVFVVMLVIPILLLILMLCGDIHWMFRKKKRRRKKKVLKD